MRCAVLGDPIAHSLSPVLHRAAYAALGLDWAYDARRGRRRAGWRASWPGSTTTWRGLSLTMPLKRDGAAAARRGHRPGARWPGRPTRWCSTDGRRLGRQHRRPGRGRRAPRAVRRPGRRGDRSWAAARPRPRPALALARPRRAGSLHAAGARRRTGPPRRSPRSPRTRRRRRVRVGSLGRPAGRRATSWSRTIPADGAGRRRWCARVRRRARCVFEVVYDPWPTPLAPAAAGAGGVLVSGLDLLVHQAALQFELFTGPAGAAGRDAGRRRGRPRGRR